MKNKLIIVLDRLRSAHNVGNIFRIAEALGAAEIIACGYTPAPPHPRLEKTAMGSDKMVPCRCFESSLEAVKTLREEGVEEILAAEPMPGSVPAWKREYKFPLAVIFGNEALGVHPETLEVVDGLVSLPMHGRISSLNASVAGAIVMYEVLRQRENRDQSGK